MLSNVYGKGVDLVIRHENHCDLRFSILTPKSVSL